MDYTVKSWETVARTILTLVTGMSVRIENASSASSDYVLERIRTRTDGNETYYSQEYDDNPLLCLPEHIRESVTEQCYEPGYSSPLQEHFLDVIQKNGNSSTIQKIINDLYQYATRRKNHTLAYNLMLSLSQIPFDMLESWASTLAVAATRSSFRDVQEMGIRCFEQWEDKEACVFLKECKFAEKWLQDYADEVCKEIIGGGEQDVLSA